MQIFNKEFESFLFLKGLQPITVQGHLTGIRRILKQTDDFNEFVVNLYKSNYSYGHKINQVKAIEYYLEFTGKPQKFCRQRKPKPLLKEALSESEINSMMLSCKSIKEKAILSLLAYSGVRPKELCRIKVSDLNIPDKTLFVNLGKGMKDGIVEISGRCIKIMIEYLSAHRPKDNLFLTYQGNNYTQGALRKLVKVVAKRAKLDRRIYPYLFRHSLAVNMVLRGAHILYVKKQLRHSFITTTMLYLESRITWETNETHLPQYC